MSYVFPAILFVIGLTILWLPVCTVALWLKKLDVPRPTAGLRWILPAQFLAVVGLVLLADRIGGPIGLSNPAGYTLAIIVLVSMAGAGLLWRRRRPEI